MTDYCTSSDVAANLKGVTFSATSTITTTGIGDIITQESAVIDQHITARYELPISDTVALSFLKKTCIDLCVYRVSKILQPQVAAPIPAEAGQDISHVTAYREAMKMLKGILDGKMTLPGEDSRGTTFVSSTADTNNETMFFDASEDQW